MNSQNKYLLIFTPSLAEQQTLAQIQTSPERTLTTLKLQLN